jgi:hypothetical protein
MDFEFKEEQLQLADALKRWIARDYGFETRREIVASAPAPRSRPGPRWRNWA